MTGLYPGQSTGGPGDRPGFDRAQRLRILAELEKRPGGQLGMFFSAQEYGWAYKGTSKGDSKATRIARVIDEADASGDTEALLRAAIDHFGLDIDLEDTAAGEEAILGRWKLGELLGEGGFGQVFAASADGVQAAVKFVPKEPGADRDLLQEELTGVPNVIPVLETGETEDSYVIVMTRAKGSLRDVVDELAGKPADVALAVAVLRDVLTCLVEIEGQVVHRDIKPDNVLRYDGAWCLADFGIARYAEATTSPDTKKHAWSAPYTAPERWRHERASTASDVYSLGVVAYELLSGRWPFDGDTDHEFRDQHLHSTPEPLEGIPTQLATLVEECLNKAPGSRPRPADLL